ncbi:MAG: hypothetical protein M1825_003920 [Sarcosagium campestre]|nr:MAG: hypothetical protein M1825_003920 [Sarcosagium campestre]
MRAREASRVSEIAVVGDDSGGGIDEENVGDTIKVVAVPPYSRKRRNPSEDSCTNGARIQPWWKRAVHRQGGPNLNTTAKGQDEAHWDFTTSNQISHDTCEFSRGATSDHSLAKQTNRPKGRLCFRNKPTHRNVQFANYEAANVLDLLLSNEDSWCAWKCRVFPSSRASSNSNPTNDIKQKRVPEPSQSRTSEEENIWGDSELDVASSQTSDFVVDDVVQSDSVRSPSLDTAEDEGANTDTGQSAAHDDIDDEEPISRPPKRARLQFNASQGFVSDPPFRRGASISQGPAAKKKLRNVVTWTYKNGIDESIEPLSDIEQIFNHLTTKAVPLGLKKAVEHLNNRRLRVATMCSGTESPILALQLVRDSLKSSFGLDLNVEHVFSAEIVPFKQAYIERNFAPPIIFRDIRELIDSDTATSAYGSKVGVPGEVDMLVAGFSCVDFSNLNGKKQQLESKGESGDTFRSIFNYAMKRRPTLIVLENVYNAPWEKIQQAWETTANYSAIYVKPDTKEYYIPHTRQRGYMLCIDRKKLGNASSSTMTRWKELMTKFKRPASAPIEAFLLSEDDPRVHRAREELAKGVLGDDKAPREVDWTKCQGRHLDYRSDLYLGSRRPMTAWEDNGSCKMPDYAWNDWGTAQVERIWDTLEISLLRNARRGFDSQFKTRVWDLSQNIDRFQDTAGFGITGCITPSGQPYVTTRGGPLIGLEALAMQGLPIDKLLLTRESQRQLQDLAGNAMTSTVVGSAMLAALIVGFKALKPGDPSETTSPTEAVSHGDKIGAADHLVSHSLNLAEAKVSSVNSILADAQRSCRLCLCEGRTTIVSQPLQRCSLCGHSTCTKCGGTPPHDYAAIPRSEIEARMAPADFENRIKDALPLRISMAGLDLDALQRLHDASDLKVPGKRWSMFKAAVQPALGVEYRYHSVHRAQFWTVNFDSPTSRMELFLHPLRVEWRAFAKPATSEAGNSAVRELLSRPFARMMPSGADFVRGEWQFCLPVTSTITVQIQGSGPLQRSWESRLGLQEPEFRDKQVSTHLHVSVAPFDLVHLDTDISGEYTLLPDCGTASGALHKKKVPHGCLPQYLFLDPSRLGNPNQDRFVFASDTRRLNLGDSRAIVASLSASWRPSADQSIQKVKCQIEGRWVSCANGALKPTLLGSRASFAIPTSAVRFDQHACDKAIPLLTCSVPVHNLPRERSTMWAKGDWVEVSSVNERNFFSSFSWLTERVRRIPILDEWQTEHVALDLVRCLGCAPTPPAVKWTLQSNKLVPYEDPEQAGPHERALKNRPASFVTRARIDEDNIGQLQIGLNIPSLLHRALGNLLAGSDACISDAKVSWRLDTDYRWPARAVLPAFTLRSNKPDPECAQPPSFKFRLRPEQLRSLDWMKRQEAGAGIEFEEEEVEEALLPALGWRAEGAASRSISVRGGVLADQVGYGKTATTLGLIDSQFTAHGRRPPASEAGLISVKATLIVVPGTLTDQWERESQKFMGSKYKVLVVKTQLNLTNLTLRDFEEADIIVVTWTIFNNETYLNKLAHFAAIPEMPSNSGRAFDAWFAFALGRVAEHVDILREQGSAALHVELDRRLAATESDEQLTQNVPSKRLRGAAYRAAQAGKSGAKGKAKAKTGGKRKADVLDDTDDSDGWDDSAGATARGSAGPTKSTATKKASSDPFSLCVKATKSDWRQMRCPLFQMFRFNRVVVDEYTYLDGKNHTCITHISAAARWVLSGTPPLGDFADVKTIAVFLGIRLGVDDDAAGVIKGQNIKNMQRDRTAVESFQAFKQVRSPAWHQNRHRLAQRFLDDFVRQNIAEIDEIPFEERLRAVVLPAAERAIYMELNQHLMSQDMKIRKGRSRVDGDREKRLNQTLGSSKTPEEALVKRCSHFTLDDLSRDRENAAQACDIVVAERERQYADLLEDFRKNLKHAVWLKHECRDADQHYHGWLQNVSANAFGDVQATADLEGLIKAAMRTYSRQDEKFFYKDADAGDEEAAGKAVAKKSKKQVPKGKKKPTLSERGKRSVLDSDDSEDAMPTSDEEEEVAAIDVRRVRLEDDMQKVTALRELAGHLRRLSTELVSRQRSLRFFRVVRELQLSSAGLLTGSSSSARTCLKCHAADLEPERISVLSLCGHTACETCLDDDQRGDDCVVPGCNAVARTFHIVKATELGAEDRSMRVGRHYGRKLESVMELIKDGIPADDQVLLFVQFDDLMEKVATALEENGISHWALTRKAGRNAAVWMSDFQNNTRTGAGGRKKVLMLNVADESASGANLTNANHVIFLSPLLTATQYRYDSSMTQAVGRARRYGQKKTVYIHRFLSLKTIDVDILEERTPGNKKLVKLGEDDFHLRPRRENDDALESFGSGGMSRKARIALGDTDNAS